MLFTLFTDDVTDVLAGNNVTNQPTTSQLYADDLKLYTVINMADDFKEFRC